MSYVSQQFLLFDNTTLANFKNWAQAISTAFSSAGWTQTADTGQVNWSTIASVPTAGNFVYEVWQPADALQTGSTAYYVKVKYGTSSNTSPRLQVQIGTGTDGSGNLTGFTTTNFEPSANTSAAQGSVVTFDSYFSGDTDRISFLLWRSNVNAGGISGISIERTHNTDGTNSSDGVTIVMLCKTTAATNPGQQTLVFGVGAAGQSSSQDYVSLTDSNNASGAFNNNIPVSPCFPAYGKYGNPMTTVAFIHTQDVAEACVFTTTLYGSTRTYIATGNVSIVAPVGAKACMRYD